jgi:uncharacterized membrane protein YecN with MAPEG domain
MVTFFYVGVFILFFVFLSINVINARHKYKIALNDGGNDKLKQLIRSHSNFIEYTPLFLIGLYCMERNIHGHAIVMHLFAIIFLAGRIIHAYGVGKFEKYENGILKSGAKLRVIGMAITFTALSQLH